DYGLVGNQLLRQLYRSLDEKARRPFGDPRHATGGMAFLEWATRPQPQEANLSPFLLFLYQVRSDLTVAFPDVRGRDRQAFLDCVQDHAAREFGCPPDLLRIDDMRVESSNGRAPNFLTGGPNAAGATAEISPPAEHSFPSVPGVFQARPGPRF